jgi:hypothetical protein
MKISILNVQTYVQMQAFSELLGICINCARQLEESGTPANPVHLGMCSWSSKMLGTQSLLGDFTMAQTAASSGYDMADAYVCLYCVNMW